MRRVIRRRQRRQRPVIVLSIILISHTVAHLCWLAQSLKSDGPQHTIRALLLQHRTDTLGDNTYERRQPRHERSASVP